MQHSEEFKGNIDSAREDFKKAFEASETGFDVNVGGLMQHFQSMQEYLDFVEELNNPANK